ncbi:MAG: TIGR03000 domain-containing protein [Bacteroidales bacterium]|nr:TIGR03000 domain-containing protein [Bacteroidales bacterium]
MYSLILMAAVASGPDANSFGWKHHRACYGCCYGYYATCYGCCGGYASCYGCCGGYSAYYGCCGGFHHHHRPYYYGGACYGSCYGSWYGAGCYGSCYGYGYSCCGGCCGGCFGTPYIGPVIESAPVAPEIAPAAPSAAPAKPAAPKTSSLMNNNPGFAFNPATPAMVPALLTVELPEGAKLFVDGQLTRGEGNVRKFHTPELPNGKSFFYELKAEVTINGQTEVEEKRVIVKAGDTISESFPRLIAAAKSQPKTLVTASR